METIDDVTGDAREVFCFSREKRPQERAHDYLERRQIRRGYRDTAMELVALDLVERARAVGASGGASPGHEAALLAIEGIARDALDGMQGGGK